MVLGGSWGSWWFWGFCSCFGGSLWFAVVIDGSLGFLVFLSCPWLFVVVIDGICGSC